MYKRNKTYGTTRQTCSQMGKGNENQMGLSSAGGLGGSRSRGWRDEQAMKYPGRVTKTPEQEPGTTKQTQCKGRNTRRQAGTIEQLFLLSTQSPTPSLAPFQFSRTTPTLLALATSPERSQSSVLSEQQKLHPSGGDPWLCSTVGGKTLRPSQEAIQATPFSLFASGSPQRLIQ